MKPRITQAIYDNYKKAFDKSIESSKESIYRKNIDELTCRMTRKKALGTWTDLDEKEYKAANESCKKEIEDLIRQSDISNYEIVSDEEYEKEQRLLEEEAQRLEEEMQQAAPTEAAPLEPIE